MRSFRDGQWARLRKLQYVQTVSSNISQICRFFGVSRALFYTWKERYEKNVLAALRGQQFEVNELYLANHVVFRKHYSDFT